MCKHIQSRITNAGNRQFREQAAREKYESVVRSSDGHHCPTWESLSELMREHLISLVAIKE
jgi:hypothetical protein